MNIQGKTIAITGAGGGIGAVIAKVLAENGAAVFVLDLDETLGLSTVQEINEAGGKAWFEKIDVTNEEDWRKTTQVILEQTGRLDGLVNNVGISIRKPIEEMSFDEFMTVMKVNVASVFLGTKVALPIMRAAGGGSIINMSSVSGLLGHKFTVEAYTTSKGAVTQLTRSVAARYASDNIRCNCICPCTVATPLVESLLQDPVRRQERIGEVPLGRLATEYDVANAVMFLASEEGSFINGVAFPVDGGVTCC